LIGDCGLLHLFDRCIDAVGHAANANRGPSRVCLAAPTVVALTTVGRAKRPRRCPSIRSFGSEGSQCRPGPATRRRRASARRAG
jgi:hypothetical protein